jgi:hypothetical protein
MSKAVAVATDVLGIGIDFGSEWELKQLQAGWSMEEWAEV